MGNKWLILGTVLFVLIGIAMLIGGVRMILRNYSFLKTAKEAQGIVTGFDVNVSTKKDPKTYRTSSSTAYYPKIKFTDIKGRQIEFVSRYGSSDPGIVEGDSVSVLYDPEHPNDAKWNTKMAIWFGPIMLTGLGLILMIVGLIFLKVFWNKPISQMPSQAEIKSFKVNIQK